MSIEITSEMVERAIRAYYSFANMEYSDHERQLFRNALTAALNPPPAPEIEVTEEMFNAGYEALFASNGPTARFGDVRAIYRAMRALEPKPQSQRASFFRDDGFGNTSVPFDERKGERRTKDRMRAWLHWQHYNAQERRNVYAGDRRKEGKQ